MAEDPNHKLVSPELTLSGFGHLEGHSALALYLQVLMECVA